MLPGYHPTALPVQGQPPPNGAARRAMSWPMQTPHPIGTVPPALGCEGAASRYLRVFSHLKSRVRFARPPRIVS